MKTVIESNWYDTKDRMFKNEPASSYEFSQTSMAKFFSEYAGTENKKQALHELLVTYKEIIKQEVVTEMEKHIENFKTFYR